MLFNPDDPKWTAYVLGELDAADRASVEQELANSPEARRLIAEILATTSVLESELQTEPVFTLSADQRETIEQQAQPMVALKALPDRRWSKPLLTLVAAASVLVAIGALLLPRVQSARYIAQSTAFENSAKQLGPAVSNHHDVKQDTLSLNKQQLPTGYYLSDDVQYAPSEPLDQVKLQSDVSVRFVDPLGQVGSGPKGATRRNARVRGRPAPVSSNQRASAGGMGGGGKGWFDNGNGNAGVNQFVNEDLYLKLTNRSGREPKNLQQDAAGLAIDDNGDGAVIINGSVGTPDELRNRINSEAYNSVTDNFFLPARQNPLSTFSIDVDTASYSNIRRFLTQNQALPPKEAVRIEEMLNYFRYDYPQPESDVPFSVTTEVAGCPWNAGHRLVRIGLKGREIAPQKRPASNLVFLLDVSGSMSDANKLPLVREAMKLLAEQLTENDRVAIVVYAGNSGLVLPSTTGDKQQVIREAIDRLQAGGSTNGGEGIQLAYDLAAGNFIKGGTNRVILATDGDFNVGITDRDALLRLITEKAQSGVFLTTLGFGMGNLKDGTLEQLADKGNGNYAYIDDMREARKVFVEQMNGTLITIAKDVKIQIEFNPAEVDSYRLIGYENRILAHQDFNDDKKDAGEIGAGHTVTALYEIAPAANAKADASRPAVDPLKYQPAHDHAHDHPDDATKWKGELLTLKLRYKQPDGDTSKLIETPVVDKSQPYGKSTADFKFASSVALFGMILRDSPHKGTGTIDAAAELAHEGLGKDEGGYRAEFLELVKRAKELKGR